MLPQEKYIFPIFQKASSTRPPNDVNGLEKWPSKVAHRDL